MDLQTLNGIGVERETMYEKLANGSITESRALAQERVLRGQSELKAAIPLRLLSIIAKTRNPGVARYGEPLMKALLKFTTGSESDARRASGEVKPRVELS